MKITKEKLVEGFKFLDDLRESGVTNMFGARPYLVEFLECNKERASKIHTLWMETFSTEARISERCKKALEILSAEENSK